MILKLTININDLFDNTLTGAPDLFNYSTDENGINLGIKYRYEFINFWLSKNKNLNLNEIENTNYFKFISKPINAHPRDGGKKWIYQDPNIQVNRFLELANSILKEGYIKSDFSNKLNEFEEKNSEHIEIDESSKITKVNYKNRKLAGLIEVMKHKNIYVVLNGHHRIAIMKSFLDNNIIKDKKILVKFEKSYFFEKVYLKIISILK